MIDKQGALKDFGFEFLGPICSEYFAELDTYLEQYPDSPVLFLAREGYLFSKAYESLASNDLIRRHPFHYLLASRTFLFRICIADPSTWELSLKHNFEGSLDKLLVARFGFSHYIVSKIFSEQELAETYSLPDDFEKLTSVFFTHLDKLSKAVGQSRSTYIDYIRELELPRDKPLILVDVGYSGTIQKLLTHLLGQNTVGVYFITTKKGEYKIHNRTAIMESVFKDNVKMGGGYYMLDKSLFLEALLTSPNGQFVDIQKNTTSDAERFNVFYGRRSYTQSNFLELDSVFSGAMEAINTYRSHNIRFSKQEIEHLYQQYTTNAKFIPSVARPLFDVDDAISGNGNVNPLQLFKV